MIYIQVVCGAARRHARKAQEQRKARDEYKSMGRSCRKGSRFFQKKKKLAGRRTPEKNLAAIFQKMISFRWCWLERKVTLKAKNRSGVKCGNEQET